MNVILATTEKYSYLYSYLRKQGTLIPINDLWIAASAMEHCVILLTSDKHFQKIPYISTIFIEV